MEASHVALISLIGIAYIASLTYSRERTRAALDYSLELFSSAFIFLVSNMVIASVLYVLIPESIVVRFLGRGAGIYGILLGALVGMIIPGGAFARLPLVAALLDLGAGVGAITALLSAKSLIYYPQGVGFLGSRITFAQTLTVFVTAISAGLIAHALAIWVGIG